MTKDGERAHPKFKYCVVNYKYILPQRLPYIKLRDFFSSKKKKFEIMIRFNLNWFNFWSVFNFDRLVTISPG